MKPKPTRKRKPRLAGWELFFDRFIEGQPVVLYAGAEPWWTGTKNLKAIGKFFIAAAEYFEGRGNDTNKSNDRTR